MIAEAKPAAGIFALFITLASSGSAAWGGGEEIGLPKPEDALRQIGQRMHDVQQRISDQDTSRPTQQLQQQVVTDLTELIRQMEKKCSGGQRQKEQKPPPKSSAPKPSAGSARDSVSSLNQQATPSTGSGMARQLNQKAWGHLPPGLREPLLNADFERFLPKYERLIERYFRRLAEESNDRP